MRELTLGGIHDDSDHLILLDSEGERYTLRIDEALRAAVRRDRSSVALLQQSHETSSLRPKEIQALLRSGASVESIAQMSDISEERIRRFEGPILAERSHMAQRAQSFRPSRGSEHSLLEVVTSRLAVRNVEQEPEWDAWRRADGTWTLQLLFVAGSRTRTATWQLDVPARVAKAEDDEARWLSDADEPSEPSQRPRLTSVRSTVFNVEESGNEQPTAASNDDVERTDRAPVKPTGSPISEEQLDHLNAQRGIPATSAVSPWMSLEEASQEPEEPALTHVHHQSITGESGGPSARNDFQTTEEVEYVEGPEDLAESLHGHESAPDPAHDPHASTPESSQDADHSDHDREEEPAPSDSDEQSEPTTNSGDETSDHLTPLPGFDPEEKKSARKKKSRASIPSWDDIVFGSRDR